MNSAETTMITTEETQIVEAGDPQAVNPLLQIHRMLRGRYWIAITLLIVGAAVGGYAGYRLAEPVYQSTGIIRVRPSLPRVLYANDQNGVMPMFDAFMQSQVELIKSQRIVDVAMQHPDWKALNRGLMPDAVGAFSGSLTAIQPKGSELVMVSFTDKDPEAARRGVAAVIDAYDRLYGENDSESAQTRMKLLEERRGLLATEHKRLAEQYRNLVGFAASGTIEKLYESKLHQMLKLEVQLQDANIAVASASAGGEGAAAATQPVRKVPTSIESLAMQIPEIARLLAMRREIERELLIDRKQFGENHRSIKDAENRLEALTTQLDELVVFYQQLILDGAAYGLSLPVGASLDQLKKTQANIEEAYAKAKAETEELGKRCYELEQVRSKVADAKDRLEETTRRIDQLNTEAGIGGRVSIESRGDRPTGPSKDRRKAFAAAGALGLGGVGVALIMLLGLFDRRIRQIADVDEIRDSGRRILGVLPTLPNEASDAEDAMVAAHGVHQIRMLLQRRVEHGRTPVIAITSATPGAGKTSLTLALGLSFAASGARTLLIDCDIIGGGLTARMKKGLRRRIGHILRRVGLINTEQLVAALKESKQRGERIGETLVRHGCVTEADVAHALDVQQSAVVGLREALNGDPANECITGGGTNRLFLMPLGSARRQHVAQLSSPALMRVLDQVRGWFDVVLIDTGPILGSLEASAAVTAADDVVLTVARGEQRPLVDRAIEQILAAGGRLAGIVLNRVKVGDILSSGFSSSTSRMSNSAGEPITLPVISEIDHQTLRLGPISNAVVALAEPQMSERDANAD